MTTASLMTPSPWPRWLWISTLIAAAAFLSPAFHCGFPLAAFAAIAALTLNRRDSLFLSGGVWLTYQTLAFASLHHHASATALAWSAALCVIVLSSCEIAGLTTRRITGLLGAVVAFVAAFVVYKLMIFGFGAAIGSSAGHLDSLLATLPRSFLTNSCVFAGLGALYALRTAVSYSSAARLSPQQA